MRTWSDADLDRALAESTERSGVPLHLEDEPTLRRIASLADVELTEVA